jgi:uncharacterized protein YgiM (DUF1202 family)
MPFFLNSIVALLLSVLSASALAASGTVLRDEKLRSQPNATASVTGQVVRGASVTLRAKQGGWLQVSAGASSGWIRLLSVRAGAGGLGGTGLGEVVGVATNRADPSRVVAVAGLRGLSDSDLKQAAFNADELARLEAAGVSSAQAKQFAGQAGLVAVSVAALPKPGAASGSESSAPASSWEAN